MNHIKLYVILISISFINVVYAQDDLSKYLHLAAENNPALKASFNQYMAALEKAPQVRALPDPQVAFGYFIQPIETRNGPQEFKLSATQMFPWFGTLKAKENVAIQTAKAKYELFEEERSKLFNEVKANWYNLYFNNKATAITLENIEILKTFKNLANVKVEAGLVSAVDRYRIEMEVNDLENQLALLRDKQLVLEISFKNLLNIKEELVIKLPDVLKTEVLLLSREAILDSIMLKNHQLINLDMQKSALVFQREAAKKEGAPKINLGIDYISIGKGDNNMSGKDAIAFPKVGLTIPLYRNKYKSMVQEVVLLETAKDFERTNKENVLRTVFANAWKDYRDATRRIELFHSQTDLAQKSLALLETEYAYANKNFEEILRMERRYLKYGLELEKAKADQQASIAFINYLMGK